MNHHRIAPVVLAATLQGLSAAGACAQSPSTDQPSGPCFEIVLPQRHAASAAGPILFDKCGGSTWMLVRSDVAGEGRHLRRSSYRWVALELEGAAPRERPSAGAKPSVSPAVATGAPARDKCFVFAGRRYCE